MYQYLFSNVHRASVLHRTTPARISIHNSSTLPDRTSAFLNSTCRNHILLNQRVSYMLREFLTEYKKKTNEASTRMENSINNKIKSCISSAENKITSAENKMLYLVVSAVIIDWMKLMIDKIYDNYKEKNQEKKQ
ncbi:hypothetical protein RCL_jg5433.t1 [Rhizophagus clarus]|uniref:Uncharacterized protein n=1 Tax=Rhizophagus clarus TaxID=94130 RepID=A0A8H3M6N6_9GLOM|nr:hypothetical protein RCL_jg5433.t1 [Rhizophagus clarus]